MEISLLVAGDHPGARVLRKSKEVKSLIRKELKKHLYALASIQKKRTGEIDLSEERIVDGVSPPPSA
jgi:stress-induced morphogen